MVAGVSSAAGLTRSMSQYARRSKECAGDST